MSLKEFEFYKTISLVMVKENQINCTDSLLIYRLFFRLRAYYSNIKYVSSKITTL